MDEKQDKTAAKQLSRTANSPAGVQMELRLAAGPESPLDRRRTN